MALKAWWLKVIILNNYDPSYGKKHKQSLGQHGLYIDVYKMPDDKCKDMFSCLYKSQFPISVNSFEAVCVAALYSVCECFPKNGIFQ